MSIERELFDSERQIPEDGETGWGAEVTALLDDMAAAVDALDLEDDGAFFPKLPAATSVLTSLATLTPTAPRHLVSGTPGAITLHATTAIADGSKDGQLLVLVGASDVNTVTVPAASNTLMNGPCTLLNREVLNLMWDLSASAWIEVSRSN